MSRKLYSHIFDIRKGRLSKKIKREVTGEQKRTSGETVFCTVFFNFSTDLSFIFCLPVNNSCLISSFKEFS